MSGKRVYLNPNAVLIMWALTMGMVAAVAIGSHAGIMSMAILSAVYVVVGLFT